eukprot:10160329-Lingulodinium_polyedra.AAC.1
MVGRRASGPEQLAVTTDHRGELPAPLPGTPSRAASARLGHSPRRPARGETWLAGEPGRHAWRGATALPQTRRGQGEVGRGDVGRDGRCGR